jgi:hypothetical protein
VEKSVVTVRLHARPHACATEQAPWRGAACLPSEGHVGQCIALLDRLFDPPAMPIWNDSSSRRAPPGRVEGTSHLCLLLPSHFSVRHHSYVAKIAPGLSVRKICEYTFTHPRPVLAREILAVLLTLLQ